MRGTAVRGHTLGISVGNPLSVEPTLDVFNEAAYESIDFAITVARVYAIKVCNIPLLSPVLHTPAISHSNWSLLFSYSSRSWIMYVLSKPILILVVPSLTTLNVPWWTVQLLSRRQISIHPVGRTQLLWHGSGYNPSRRSSILL